MNFGTLQQDVRFYLSLDSTKTNKQPLVLHLEKVHHATLIFFIRMWASASASFKEFDKISKLVRFHFRFLFKSESELTIEEFEKQMKTISYSAVKERQAIEIEEEEDLLHRLPIK